MTHFEQITSVHYQAISHTVKLNLQFFHRSKKLRKTSKNWSQKFTKHSKQYGKSSFKSVERKRTYVLIDWWPITHHNQVYFFSSKRSSYFVSFCPCYKFLLVKGEMTLCPTHLQQDISHILRNRIHYVVHAETCKQHLM